MALVAKESTDDSTVSARANQTKEDQSVTYDVDKDNIINNNVTNYVVNSLDTNSIKSNIVLSTQPAKSFITSPKSKIEYVEDCKSNIFSSSQVNNFLADHPTIKHTISSYKDNVYNSAHQKHNIQQPTLHKGDKTLSNIVISTNNKISTDSKVEVINHHNIELSIDNYNSIQSTQKKSINQIKNYTTHNNIKK